MVVSRDKEKIGSAPIDDIGILLITNLGCSMSGAAINALLERGAQVVFCGKNFVPNGMLLPLITHLTQSEKLNLQIKASAPLKKRLWAQIVCSKIRNQAAALEAFGQSSGALHALAKKVRSGDPDNIEAQAARYYWPKLLGEDFRRDKCQEGANSLLNYGYTIIRAAMARAVAASGLTPCLSLHHSSKENPFALVDDLVEPFRPMVDAYVFRLVNYNMDFICPDTKTELCSLLMVDLETRESSTTLPQLMINYCYGLLECYAGKKAKLDKLDLSSFFSVLSKETFGESQELERA